MEHLLRYWPFAKGIHRWPVDSLHKGQWRGALTVFFICAWINGWGNNRDAVDFRCHRVHDSLWRHCNVWSTILAIAQKCSPLKLQLHVDDCWFYYEHFPWWCHQMKIFSALLALCAGNSQVTGEFPAQRPVKWSIDVFLNLRLIKWLNKHSWGWWLRRYRAHYDVAVMPNILCH